MKRRDRLGPTATLATLNNDVLKVQYHDTTVVIASLKTGEVVLDTGGWFTATTKARMNQAARQYSLGYEVVQRKKEWFVKIAGRPDQKFSGSSANFVAPLKSQPPTSQAEDDALLSFLF